MPLLYDAAVGLYHFSIRAIAPFKPKARAWVEGRVGLWERLEEKRSELQGCLWMHCASVGEFEQGRPVLEAIKREQPGLPVLLTFFSPSGYEARKDLGSTKPGSLVTHVEYLPPDTKANAEQLVALLKPRASIFVKYEFWYHHLHALKAKGVPVFLISALFRPEQAFFRWYGATWRRILDCYAHIFTQDEASAKLLRMAGLAAVTVGGDTRFDRVVSIAAAADEFAWAAAMRGSAPVVVCGSTWPADDALITQAIRPDVGLLRIIVAPHELEAAQLNAIAKDYPAPVIRWSTTVTDAPPLKELSATTLLVDRIGLLARLYAYADIAYIGGGFGDGIHSVLEAAAWGKPVIFGPRHIKFPEARGLIEAGAAWEVRSAQDLHTLLKRLLNDREALAIASAAALRYVRVRTGATERIVVALRSHL